MTEPAKLGARAKRAISDSQNEVWVSSASLWEIAIKVGTGKLSMPPDQPAQLPRLIGEAGFQILPILAEHAVAVAALPHLHRDPFDRLLVAQAGIEGLTIVTVDPAFVRYAVPILGANR